LLPVRPLRGFSRLLTVVRCGPGGTCRTIPPTF
jgi:hypothetical protein